ncbi:MAG: hypothetical protein PHS07_02795 [Patescibacteria group bacterium]|nr:hypothetical protein [Patescibacteria group bacterium]
MNPEKITQEFLPDETNRLDVLNQENFNDLPEYIQVSREFRDKLCESIETEGWPEYPNENVKGIEDFFNQAKDQVDQRWEKYATGVLSEDLKKWADEIPNHKSNKEIKFLLSNPEELEEKLKINQFGVLESLRNIKPEAWRELVLSASERQLARVVLTRHWMKEMSDEQFEILGINKSEMEILLDAAGIFGKYIDHAYVKQIEMADRPGGQEKTQFEDDPGSECVYEFKSDQPDKIDLKPYIDVFPFEFKRIDVGFNFLSQKVRKFLDQGKLPEAYNNLPDYLENISRNYISEEVTFETLDKNWKELYAQFGKISQSECPLMVIPQGNASVAGDASKVDIELRLGVKTLETREMENEFQSYRQTAQFMLDKVDTGLDEKYKIPEVNLNYQPFAFGSDLFWMTRGESDEKTISSHVNSVADVAIVRELPLLQKTFLEMKTDQADYTKLAVDETVRHEIGHSVASWEDKKVLKRIGTGFNADVLEELKAETLGAEFFYQKAIEANLDSTEIKKHFSAKMGAMCDYLANKDKKSEADRIYYYSGVAMFDKLLEQGVIVMSESGQYEITDAKKGFEVLGEIGKDILNNFHTNSKIKPKEVKQNLKGFIQGLKEKDKKDQVQSFIEFLKK